MVLQFLAFGESHKMAGSRKVVTIFLPHFLKYLAAYIASSFCLGACSVNTYTSRFKGHPNLRKHVKSLINRVGRIRGIASECPWCQGNIDTQEQGQFLHDVFQNSTIV